MTKEEMKALVSAKIAGQGNQVDLGNALPELLNAIVDSLPERAPITIDLTGYELTNPLETDVTDAIPQGYEPKIGDKVIFGTKTFFVNGVSIMSGNIYATFGTDYSGDDIVFLGGFSHIAGNVEWYAGYYEI